MLVEVVVRLGGRLAERVREEARRRGVSVEEYLVELLGEGLDPKEKAAGYLEAARSLLEQAVEELREGDARQAAEKVWGAVALAVKAYAYWRDGRRLESHRELWEYKRVMAGELGGWVSDAWYAGQSMHVCFYEGWCSREDVEEAVDRARRLLEGVASKVGGS